jgi:hypothetical protein
MKFDDAFHGTGQVWLDTVSFGEADRSVPKTDFAMFFPITLKNLSVIDLSVAASSVVNLVINACLAFWGAVPVTIQSLISTLLL